MLLATVKFDPDGSDGLRETQPASPSPADPTRTSQPLQPGTPAPSAGGDAPPAAPQLRDPSRYDILGEHGRGGLGRVSRAHDRELGRDIAVKELITRGHVSEVRFLREALITARLQHPGIVPVYEAGRWPDGTPFYAMKLVAGRSLRELIVERTTVDERIALLHHVIAVADAIAYAHDRHIIHRDLKPANVIVGDFGETVVIDWGLAKDLSIADDDSASGGPVPIHRDDGLTSAGAVLGTPAYMAPEQERGEPVDQRADVFAIGAMLWELCALERLPPSYAGQRHTILRRAGIDQDLATIVDKALDPDPARRYRDAGALAADLKAFKAGARIAARRYSPLAMLAHWTRRHRALSLSVIAITSLTVTGIIAYVRNIAAERDRTDAALVRTAAAKDDLTLEHAELLLHSDPTAAVTALSAYRGNDDLRRRRLLAEAIGLGVARKTFAPHSDTIWFLVGDRDGTIVSLGEDGRIQSTREGKSTPLATDVSLGVRLTYAPSSGVLAYATSPPGIALLRLRERTSTRITSINPAAMRFAPDDSRLAAISDKGELIVWSLASSSATEIYRASLPKASRVLFMTPTLILVQHDAAIRTIAIERTGSSEHLLAASNITSIDTQSNAAIIGTGDGNIELLSATLDILTTSSLCHKRVNSIQFSTRKRAFLFACQDGYSGMAHLDNSLTNYTITDIFPTRGSSHARFDPTGRYATLFDESQTAYIFDTETRILHRYDGHAGQPTYIAAPTPDFQHVLTGDANGTVRVWDLPPTGARVVLQAPVPLFSLAFANDSRLLLVNGSERLARGINITTNSVFELSGHTSGVYSTRISPDGASMLTYGYDGTVRVWRTSDRTLIRVFVEHKGMIGEADYADARHIVSVGNEGQLLQWSPEGTDVTSLFRSASPLRRLEVLTSNAHIVVNDSEGTVWDIAPDHAARQIRSVNGETITSLRASRDGKFAAIGTDAGTVTVYDTANWTIIRILKTGSGIRQLAFDPLNRDILIASESSYNQPGHVRLVELHAQRRYHWHDIAAAARDVAYAPDGNTIGLVCTDGSTWLYSMDRDIWTYANEERADTLAAQFSPDGRLFASVSHRGALVVRDVASSFDSSEQVIPATR